MILRLLNWQGIAGIVVTLTLIVMLTVQKLETLHWKKHSEKFEQLYQQEQAAFATTTANYRAAAAQARAKDAANAERVRTAQAAINQETQDAFQIRLADARARAERLHLDTKDPADSRIGRAAPVPGLPAPTGSASKDAREDRLPAAQLNYSDALHAVEPSAEPSAQP
jgi:biopolymer transport protein ExbB/TolQ